MSENYTDKQHDYQVENMNSNQDILEDNGDEQLVYYGEEESHFYASTETFQGVQCFIHNFREYRILLLCLLSLLMISFFKVSLRKRKI